MYGNKVNRVLVGSNHSISKRQIVKELAMSNGNILHTSMRRLAWLLLACTSITTVAGAAQASGPADFSVSKVVSLKDLNLHSTAGVAAAYGRIALAADEVCGALDRFGVSQSPATRRCIHEAVSKAVAEVHSPMLTSLHKAKTGQTDEQLTALSRAN